MTYKFKIGDIIADKNNPENQWEILDIIKDSEKLIKGDWFFTGKEERLIPENSYILKDPKTNKLTLNNFKYIDNRYQLFQPVKEKPLKWKNYEEVFV